MAKPIATEEKEEKEEYPMREWIPNPKGIPEIYSNFLHASWSLFEVRILLGLLKPRSGASSDFIVEEQGAVYLSWPQIKNLAGQLAGMVAAYESVNGEIKKLNLPPRYEDIQK